MGQVENLELANHRISVAFERLGAAAGGLDYIRPELASYRYDLR